LKYKRAFFYFIFPFFFLRRVIQNRALVPRFREYGSNQDRENYEALLNLAERLGDAKPKGLVKSG
jgi:hypothetical protein